jgi:hypothetical protein
MLAGEETQKETLVLDLFHTIMLSHLQNDLVKKLKVFKDVQTIYICTYIAKQKVPHRHSCFF